MQKNAEEESHVANEHSLIIWRAQRRTQFWLLFRTGRQTMLMQNPRCSSSLAWHVVQASLRPLHGLGATRLFSVNPLRRVRGSIHRARPREYADIGSPARPPEHVRGCSARRVIGRVRSFQEGHQ